MKAQSQQALALAQLLETHPKIAKVYYPGLQSDSQHALAMRQMSSYGGAVVLFDVKADDAKTARAKAFKVLDQLETMSLCINLGDTITLLTHPASTSHGKLSDAQRAAANIGQGLIRVAVGLEHLDDIKADIERGLA